MDRTIRGMTRRRALAILGAPAAAGAVGAAGRQSAVIAWLGQRQPQPDAPTFPRGAVIRTLFKDMPPDALAGGPVLFHEHLSMRYPPQAKEHFTDDVALMIEEARAARTGGIACIVDGGHSDMSRNLDALKRIATESGMPIVASGGYYMQRTYPPEISTKPADQIAEELVHEAAEQHLGAFGEIGQQGGVLTDDEKKVFQAVAKAQVRTGLPIFTHNAYTGTRPAPNPVPPDAALRQLDVLEGAGARLEHLAIGHVCCLDDPRAEVAQQVAKRGAFVGFDRVTIPIVPDAERVVMIMAMVEAGYADQVLISSDFAMASSLKKNGGAGLAQASTVFGPMLVRAGLSDALLHRILVDNPRRFLAFVPVPR
jgi:phosphotriesterase-related protein